MFFKVTALALLAYLAIAPSPPPAAVPVVSPPPPPAPMVVVVPAAASTTRVVDVRRADLEQALREPRLSHRLVPALTHGKPSGLKLYAIRPGSPLAAIGLENGDTVRAINDIPLTSPESALEIYRPLKEPDHFDLDIVRKGERVRILVLVH